MACSEEREKLVPELRVGHPATVLVTRAQQQREHVRALLEIGLGAAARDLLMERRVRCAQAPSEKPARAERA